MHSSFCFLGGINLHISIFHLIKQEMLCKIRIVDIISI